MSLVDVSAGCAPLAGHAIYLWHCDAVGRYSIYDLPEANYLRGVVVTDAKGEARLTTIFPGCYPGRFPHMHFEVYPRLATATSHRNRILTSQLALPAEACAEVYGAAPGYGRSAESFARSPLDRDGVFRDNTAKQMTAQTMTLAGDAASGYRGRITIGLET